MKIIKLKTLILENFKGTRSLKVDFCDTTNIYGDNGTGKTTIFDAFFWLLFNKDSLNKSDFKIKTHDSEGNEIHNLSHSVTGDFEVNGLPLTLSKTLTEKWVKKRGQKEQEFSGHETSYKINEVPVTMAQYKARITELIDEQVFMLLTNPLFFSRSLKWKERRDILIKILGEVSDSEILEANPELKGLAEHLEKYTSEELLKITKSTKTKLNDELKTIPVRIKENEIQINHIDPHVDMDILAKQAELEELQKSMTMGGDHARKKKLLDESIELRAKITELSESAIKERTLVTSKSLRELENVRYDIAQIKTKDTELKGNIETSKRQITSLEAEQNQLRAGYKKISGKIAETEAVTFDEHKSVCPTCGQDLPEEQVQELKEKFNQEKAEEIKSLREELKKITESGKKISEKIKGIEEEQIRIEQTLTDLVPELAFKESELESKKETHSKLSAELPPESEESRKLNERLKEIKEELKSTEETDISEELKEQEKKLKEELQELNQKASRNASALRAEERIRELEAELEEKRDQYTEAERLEYLIEQFTRAKVSALEERVNQNFKMVKFRLFEQQINGGISDTCQILVDTNGSLVPYDDANNAAKYAAGIDIINTLHRHYDTVCPIFLDNRESVTHIPHTAAQVINLIVSGDDKKLRVECE